MGGEYFEKYTQVSPDFGRRIAMQMIIPTQGILKLFLQFFEAILLIKLSFVCLVKVIPCEMTLCYINWC